MSSVVFTGKLARYVFKSDNTDFKIAAIVPREEDKDDLSFNQWGNVTVKGDMDLMEDTDYVFTCYEQEDKQWGMQYALVLYKRKNTIEDMNPVDFENFMMTLNPTMTALLVKHYGSDKLRDILKHVSDTEDYDQLTEVKGIGFNKAQKLIQQYRSQQDYSAAVAKMSPWGFSTNLIMKIVRSCGSQDIAIKKFSENPYVFCGAVKGVGFKTIDNKALEHGIADNDPRRVQAFVRYLFDELAESGDTRITLDNLKTTLVKEIYKCDLHAVIDHLKNSGLYKVYKFQGDTWVSLKEYFDLETDTARELLRLYETNVEDKKLENVDKIIADIEKEQGWQYADEQRQAIQSMLDNQVFLLQGLGGTGKSTTIKAVVEVAKANGWRVAQCALSGKAADNLSQVTGVGGRTIHRLLGADQGGKFKFRKGFELPYDLIIVDEISMVNLELFNHLLQAMYTGAKLIMVGDAGQLDSIGVGVMRGILDSQLIPTQTLTQIHRQAIESAIITHSIAMRKGLQPKELDTSVGRKLYGKKKDLGYYFVEEEKSPDKKQNFIVMEAIKVFGAALKKYNVDDIQVITSTVKNSDDINRYCQQLANPASGRKNEYKVQLTKDSSYVLREGDKVINVVNNRDTCDEKGNSCPIYNGNTGILKSVQVIERDGKKPQVTLVIDFQGIGTVVVEDKIKNIRLGYCITVHKSQGSTIPCVIVALPFNFKLNSRELIYTAITRAKSLAYVITSKRTLQSTLKKSTNKIHATNLARLIQLNRRRDEDSEKVL